jgi:hypothetical protein
MRPASMRALTALHLGLGVPTNAGALPPPLRQGVAAPATCAHASRRYEGQFVDGRMDGFGVYIWNDGT